MGWRAGDRCESQQWAPGMLRFGDGTTEAGLPAAQLLKAGHLELGARVTVVAVKDSTTAAEALAPGDYSVIASTALEGASAVCVFAVKLPDGRITNYLEHELESLGNVATHRPPHSVPRSGSRLLLAEDSGSPFPPFPEDCQAESGVSGEFRDGHLDL